MKPPEGVKRCCSEMRRAIKDETIIDLDDDGLAIRGTPVMTFRGNGFADNEAENSGINYCPFCGSRLPVV